MSRLIRNLLLASIALITSQAALADDLFSEITISSVFTDSSKQDESASKSGTGRQLSGPGSLRRTLAEAGFRPQDLENDSVLVVADAPQTKDGVLNVTIEVKPDRQRIVIAARLVKIVEENASSKNLLKLMASSRSHSGIYFTTSDNTVSVQRTLENADVSANWLKSKINELVDYANSNAASWQALGTTMATVESELKQDAVNRSSSESSFSMVGKWSASGRKGESFGIVFEDSRFRLAIVANGNVSQSNGTWSLQDDRLTLTSEGSSLSVSVKIQTSDKVVLKFDRREPLTFTRK